MSATDSAERGRREPIDADFDEPGERAAPRGVGMGTAVALSTIAALGGGAIGALAPRSTEVARLIDQVAPDELAQTRAIQAEAQRSLSDIDLKLKAIDASGGVSPDFAADYAAAKADLEAIKRKVANIDAGLKLLPNGPSEAKVLRDRILALEAVPKDPTKAAPEQLARAMAGMQARVDSLEARAGRSLAFETASGIGPDELVTRLQSLQNESRALDAKIAQAASAQDVAVLTTDLKKLQSDFSEVAAGAKEAITAARAAYAVAAATDASRSSGPFPQAYSALEAALPGNPHVIALGPLSAKGAPTKDELRGEFDKIDLEIVRAARAADSGGGIWGQLQSIFAQFIVVRRTGEGDTPDTIVERAGARLAADDLQGAVTELSRLRGPAGAKAEPWLKKARLRIEIDARLAAIRAELARKG